jgi:hypothetical protein
MLKIDNLIGQLLLSFFLVAGVARSGLTQEVPPAPDNRGLCQLNDLAGHSIIDSHGQLINLVDFCGQPQAVPLAGTQTASDRDRAQEIAKENQDEEFWRSFNEVASPDAIQFSHTLDRQQIIAYSATICPYLSNGGTLQQVRQIQATSKLPTSFDVAVTIAAIHTYCPEYTTQIGR